MVRTSSPCSEFQDPVWSILIAPDVPQMLRVVYTLDPVPRVPLHLDDALGMNHAGKLAELDTDGTPIPLDEIHGKLLSHQHLNDHNRSKYAAMIAGLIEKFQNNDQVLTQAWGDSPLHAAAQAEASSVERLLL